MKLLDKFLCAVGRHELTTWRRTDNPKPGPYSRDCVVWPISVGPPPSISERHCKRPGCKYTEGRNLRRPRKPRRPANEADTVQAKQ